MHKLAKGSAGLRHGLARAPIVDALEGPRVVPKAPTWKGSAILSQFCFWLKDDDGSKKSDKDACQYVKQVEVIFDRAGVEDTRILPDFSTLS